MATPRVAVIGAGLAGLTAALDLALAGARVVVGHHPHVVQSWEHYGRGVIFYSLGNLVFDQFQRMETQRGQLAEVVFSEKTVLRVDTIPVSIGRTGPRVAVAAGA